MENSDEYLERLRTSIDQHSDDLTTLIERTTEKNYLCLFVSFDIENSTRFKVEHTESWATIFTGFYEIAKKHFQEKFHDVRVWKYVGDEILFYLPIKCKNILKDFLPEFFDIHVLINNSLRILCGNLSCSDIVYCKPTVWLAPIQELDSKNRKISDPIEFKGIYKNLQIGLSMGESIQKDFIGPDIDIGFRTAKNSFRNVITISADFAYILYQFCSDKEKMETDMRICSYEKLKGVWKGNYYPIIWYYLGWKAKTPEFEYAEYLENDAIKNIRIDTLDSINKLDEILDRNGRISQIKEIISVIYLLPDDYEEEDYSK